MTYKQAISYLYSLEEERINLGLSRIKSLLFNLSISPEDLKVLHIAGTNGKGSVAAIASSILAQIGFKVGVYTSPHLKDFRERIVIKCSGAIYRTESQRVKCIPKKELINLVEKIKPIVKKISRTEIGKPTFFEVTTAIMFNWFVKEKVDFLVLEVGLGGRLDATNVVSPLVSVITNIGLEHTDRLGSTLEEITKEKCGIIKRDCPVITAEKNPKILKIIESISHKKNARLIRIGRDVKYKFEGFNGKLQFFNYEGISHKFKRLPLPLIGKHQLANACCAIASIEFLIDNRYLSKVIKKSLRDTKWPGRCEIISRSPMLILDGAHNPQASSTLISTLGDYFSYDRLILILGILRDKDIDGIMHHLVPLANVVIFTSPSNPRAASPFELMNYLPLPISESSQPQVGTRCSSFFITDNVPHAIKLARQIASRQDMILITGSLYTVANAREK